MDKVFETNFSKFCSSIDKICIFAKKFAFFPKILVYTDYLWGNNMPFINKNLVNGHRKRTRLRKKFLKNRTESNGVCYNKQQNFCVTLLRNTKKDYYGNLNKKDVIHNKKFWKTAKPLFSDKAKSSEKVTLIHEDKVITTDDENAKILNSFFSNVVKHLKIPEFKDTDFSAESISHPAL